MKKLILSLLLVVSTLFVSAQTFNKVTETRFELYNGSEWVVKERVYPENMYVIIKDRNIKITNQDESEYEATGDADHKRYNTHHAYTWTAIGKDGKSYFLMIKTSLENKILEVAFLNDGVCYVYSFVKK